MARRRGGDVALLARDGDVAELAAGATSGVVGVAYAGSNIQPPGWLLLRRLDWILCGPCLDRSVRGTGAEFGPCVRERQGYCRNEAVMGHPRRKALRQQTPRR